MKNWTLILFILMFFTKLFAQITIYEEIGKDPDESQLDTRAEEAQGVASDRLNHWFFSNRYHIYKYDENFSNVSQDNVGTLNEVNDVIDNAICGHIGSIHYNDGYIYAEVDDCKREESLPELIFASGDEEEMKEGYESYFYDKYAFSGDVVVEEENGLYYIYYRLNSVDVEVCILAYLVGWRPYECYTKPSFSVKFTADILNVVDYQELLTPDGFPIKSSGCAYNPIDGLFYNQCPANITLNDDDLARNKNSICGFDFNERTPSLMLKSIIKLGEDHPGNIGNNWWNQGGTFAENGVFLYVLDDASENQCSSPGFHVYYPDYANAYEEEGVKIYEAQRFAAGVMKYDAYYGEYRREELEGITVWRNSPLGGDIHIVKLFNRVGDDWIWLHHFESGDWDYDKSGDMIDNCPFVKNYNQEDWNEDGIGDACQDYDGDGKIDSIDNCPDISNPDQNDWNDDEIGDACQDSDNDGVLDVDDKCLSKANSDQADYDEDGVGDVCDNCPMNYNPDQTDSDEDGVGDACDRCPGGFSIYKKTSPNNELISAKDIDGYSKGAALLGLGYYTPDRKYFVWQPDHDLDGIPDACDNYQGNNTGFAYSRINNVKGLGPTPPIDAIPNISAPRIKNFKARIGISMPEYSGNHSTACTDGICNVAVHYCAIADLDFKRDRWGQDGYCTTTEKTENPLYKETADNKFTCDFGFSHGSDDYKTVSIQRWRKRITTQDVGLDNSYNSIEPDNDPSRALLKKKGDWTTSFDWNWRRDWYVENRCDDPQYSNEPICLSLRNPAEHDESFTMYYALSTNAAYAGTSFTYKDQSGTEHINGLYFGKSNIYSRSNRYRWR